MIIRENAFFFAVLSACQASIYSEWTAVKPVCAATSQHLNSAYSQRRFRYVPESSRIHPVLDFQAKWHDTAWLHTSNLGRGRGYHIPSIIFLLHSCPQSESPSLTSISISASSSSSSSSSSRALFCPLVASGAFTGTALAGAAPKPPGCAGVCSGCSSRSGSGSLNVPSSFAMVSDLVFAYAICFC
jgi:hypothetical protein